MPDDAWTEFANGNAYTPFAELMALRRADGGAPPAAGGGAAAPRAFLSRRPAYSPGGFTRAFGGHVYAQAALAAARTVRPGFVLHVRVPPPPPSSPTLDPRPLPAGAPSAAPAGPRPAASRGRAARLTGEGRT
jgi:hypothetical protein